MAVLSKGTTFATGDQVTAGKLNNLADNATFASGAVDNTTTQLSSGAIIVKDGGVSTAKLANDAATPAKVSFVDDSLASTDGHILVADGSEYNNVAVSGDVTIDNTGAVTIANDAVESAMIADDVALGGNPTTTTQAAGNNSTRIATTAFVQTAITNSEGTPNNRLRIKVLPADFVKAVSGTTYNTQVATNGSYVDVESDVVASYDLPDGYKATEVVIYGRNFSFTVRSNDITDGTTATSVGTGSTSSSSVIAVTSDITDVTASDTNYLSIYIPGSSNSLVGGGYITLVAV